MAATARLNVVLSVVDTNGNLSILHEAAPMIFASSISKLETVSLTGSAFTALSPPSGAKAVLILPGTSVSLSLKSVTGDGGIAVTPASSPLSVPILLPLGATPSIGIANGSASTQSVECIWI